MEEFPCQGEMFLEQAEMWICRLDATGEGQDAGVLTMRVVTHKGQEFNPAVSVAKGQANSTTLILGKTWNISWECTGGPGISVKAFPLSDLF